MAPKKKAPTKVKKSKPAVKNAVKVKKAVVKKEIRAKKPAAKGVVKSAVSKPKMKIISIHDWKKVQTGEGWRRVMEKKIKAKNI